MMNIEIIINVFAAMVIYNLILAAIGKVLIRYFLENSETVQKEKKSFQDRLKEKVNQS